MAQNELTRNAINLARQKELETYQRALDVQWLNDRMEDGRMGRCMALIKKEAQMEKEFQERTDHAALVNERARKETALGIEVAKVQHDEATQLLRRHYLRERDPGLRELTSRLRAGYVCRDLQQQILHNEYRRLQEKVEEKHASALLLHALGTDNEVRDQEELEKMKKSAAYCRELQQQLVNRQRQKQCQYEEQLVEQKMLDDVMRTIADEDQRELKQKRDLVEKLQKEMVTFQQARDAWRVKQRAVMVQEELEIQKQQQAASDRSASIVAERARQAKIKEKINEKICAKIMADEAERQDRDNVILQLQEQELLEKYVQDDIAESRKTETLKSSTKADLTAQMRLKRQELEQERRRQLEFRKEADAKIAELEAKEQEKQRKQKEKAREYYNDLKRQIEDNARRRETERDRELARVQAVRDYDRDWQAEVSKEREKIVQEHVPRILGYVRAGVIGKADIPAVRAGVSAAPELAALDIDAMATAKEVKRYPKCNAQCRVLREY